MPLKDNLMLFERGKENKLSSSSSNYFHRLYDIFKDKTLMQKLSALLHSELLTFALWFY